jgi:hypothetical protein
MARTVADIQADIDKLTAMLGERYKRTKLTNLIENEIQDLEGAKHTRLEARAERRAERVAVLDSDISRVDAMLLEPDTSQYVIRKLELMKERLLVRRSKEQ